jgi:hypothetical protein
VFLETIQTKKALQINVILLSSVEVSAGEVIKSHLKLRTVWRYTH